MYWCIVTQVQPTFDAQPWVTHDGAQQWSKLAPLGALVFSVMSFIGRDFFRGGSLGYNLTLDDPLTIAVVAEVVVGLLIEISFIATFTQHFFGSK